MEQKILDLLKDKRLRTSLEIIEELNLGEEYDEEVIQTLNKLSDNYTLYCTRKGKYMLFSDSELSKEFKKGVFRDTQNDYGFVDIGETDDIFIHGSNTNGAIEGDTVLVKIVKNKNNDKRCEGIVVAVVEHNIKNKVGEVYHYQGKMMVQLDDKKFKKLIVLEVPHTEINRLVDGDKVIVSLDNPTRKKDSYYLYAKFLKRIGHINDPDIDILSIIAENGIDVEFPDDVIEELKTIPTEVEKIDLIDRKDLRDDVIFTIDGDDTKDIDDAISIKKLDNGNYELGVHIADVSYYVKEDSPLDKAARDRGTSVYLTDRVIPMIPHQLSNGICSLNPNVDRLAVSCVMEVNNKGHVEHYDIFPSVIKSRIQMTYNKVNDILEKNVVADDYKEFEKSLREMNELAHILRKMKEKRGYIDFDVDEAKILVDENCKPLEIKRRYRGEGEKLIEDFMIAANECVATHIYFMNLPFIYRVHEVPQPDKISDFLRFVSSLGYSVKGDPKDTRPTALQYILEQLHDKKEYPILSTLLLRCMQKAIYKEINLGHYALGSQCYTHFTSPIRRYPDTTVHRLLHQYLFDGSLGEIIVNKWESKMPFIAEQCSLRERNAVDCEREVDDLKMAEYMEDHIGEQFDGMISSVTNFGMFVQLDNLIEGLVPVRDMPDFFHFDEEHMCLVGEKSKIKYTIGERIRIKVVRASKEKREIDFEIVRKLENEKES